MTVDPKANPGPSPVAPQPGEEFFRQSIADLSRRLGERSGRQSETEAQANAEGRRRAMKAYELERARRLRLMLRGAGAVVATACIAWFFVILGEPEAPTAPGPIASARPIQAASPLAMAAAEPAPQAPKSAEPPPAAAPVTDIQSPPDPVLSTPVQAPASPPPTQPAPVTNVQPAPAPEPAPPVQAPAVSPPPSPTPQTAAATPSDPPPVKPAPPLGREEIREVQKRLLGFGFNPGPVDGVAGRRTEVAVQYYLESRGQPQMPPTERQLLEQLRQDPAPPVAQASAAPTQAPAAPTQVAQRAARSGSYATQPSTTQQSQRSFDPFQPVKVAGAEITRWLQSVFR